MVVTIDGRRYPYGRGTVCVVETKKQGASAWTVVGRYAGDPVTAFHMYAGINVGPRVTKRLRVGRRVAASCLGLPEHINDPYPVAGA